MQALVLNVFFRREKSQKNQPPILGPAAGFIASLQVLEVIKLLTGTGKLLTGRLLYFNAELMACSFADVSRRVDCPVCGDETHVPV